MVFIDERMIYDKDGKKTSDKIGDLSGLQTTSKQSLVNAINENTSALAEKARQSDLIRNSRRDIHLNALTRNIPLVSFIDDDGNRAILTKLLPLADTYNIPFTVCVPSDFALAGSGLTIAEFKDLQDNHNFEIASHAKTHTTISDSMSKEQQFLEVYESWRVLRENGLNIETMVYPYGQSTSYTKEIVSRYYKCAFSTDAILNTTPFRTYALGRIEFPTAGWTLDNYKAKVDEAVTKNAWLVFMLHCGDPKHDATQQAILEQLIQYIKSINIDIVKATDGIDISGNIIDIGQQTFYYAKDGKNNIRDLAWEPLNPTTGVEKYNFSTKPNQFPNLKVIVTNVFNDNANSPSGQRGVLITYTQEGTSQEAYQTFRSYDKTYERRSSNADTWGTWRRLITTAGKVTANVTATVPANGTVVAYITLNPADYSFNKMVLLNPQFTLNTGLHYSYSLDGANGRIKINLENTTAADIVLTNSVWQYVLMDA